MFQAQISAAIRAKRVIQFRYKGAIRRVEPHALGYDQGNVLTLSAWQLSGGSGQEFRDFHVDKLSGLSTTEQTFASARRGYNPNDPTLSRVVARL